MFHRIFIISLFSICLQQTSWAQLPNTLLYDKIELNAADSGRFSFGMRNTNYMRNTEYFNPIEEGRTLFGYQLQPSISYQPSKTSILQLGAWFRHDFGGTQPFTKVIPTFSLKVLGKKSEIIFGTLEGALSHGMLEPLLDINKLIENRIENGFQYKLNGKRIGLDTWINWENFIEPNAFDKERFTMGVNSKLALSNHSDIENFHAYYQMMLSHQGGQIDRDTIQPFLMFYNGAVGVKLNTPIHASVNALVDISVLHFKELSESNIFNAKEGNAFYANAGLGFGNNTILASYWLSSDYNAPRGTSLYQSRSTVDSKNYQKDRQLVFLRFIHNNKLFKSPINASARFEPVYDINNGILDFSYSLYLVYHIQSPLRPKH